MTEPVVRFQNVSKTFRGFVTESIGTRLKRMVRGAAPRGRVYALNDVSFDLYPGESVALMGLNGSGKTTALSMIARITAPSAGSITVKGRVGALLAVGTGLHGDLTGRENLDVYARILGYSPADVKRKFDQIVEFAEIGDALDRPLKFYSSGMQLRLGFSIAAHVEPEVMLVDEAVSVGDVVFQQRCLEKMTELVTAGSALVLVSHQPEIVARTCTTGLLLRKGELVSQGPMEEIIGQYLDESGKRSSVDNELLELVEWDIREVDHEGRRIVISMTVNPREPLTDPRFGITIADLQHGALLSPSMALDDVRIGLLDGRREIVCEVTNVPLRAGVYRVVGYALSGQGGEMTMSPHVLGHITWGDPNKNPVVVSKYGYGPVVTPAQWTVN